MAGYVHTWGVLEGNYCLTSVSEHDKVEKRLMNECSIHRVVMMVKKKVKVQQLCFRFTDQMNSLSACALVLYYRRWMGEAEGPIDGCKCVF